MYNFTNKKIGIWGFGVVGQSALTYFDQYPIRSIQILDTKQITLPSTKNIATIIIQTTDSIRSFLEDNDYILVSPGIKLHDYQQFSHKFISELDIYQIHASWPTIAITGSLGKTSITHLLTTILQKINIQALAAGNIGYGMLNLLIKQPACNTVVLELSSFQLQQAQTFAPNLAIITNLYENHLDHHKDMHEYVAAKCNIFKHQSNTQQTLLPLENIDQIITTTPLQAHWTFFNQTQLTDEQCTKYQNHTIYYLDEKKLYKTINKTTILIFDINDLPAITFDTNWLVIIATLDMQQLPFHNLAILAQQLNIPDHRLQKIGSWHGSHFYNDSKSTVWQATLQAVLNLEQHTKNPIKLFLGGMDKGVDRTPLFLALSGKNIEIFAFGHQADTIASLCKKFNIAYQACPTLDGAWHHCINNLTTQSEILFSPGGASFDLFTDYKARGKYFEKLVQSYCQIEQSKIQ